MIRLDYLDDLVWRQILELLRSPELIRAEMERRRMESLSANPVQQRQEQLERQLSRAKQQMDKLLDAYQEDLLNLSDLRARAPALKKKIAALESERQNLGVRALEDQKWIEINQSLESFVARLNQTAQNLTTAERQKIVRLLVKQIDVGKETMTIHHSIPIDHSQAGGSAESSRLYKRRQTADSCGGSEEFRVSSFEFRVFPDLDASWR